MTGVVRLEILDGVAEIHFNRPDRLNMLDEAMARGFRDAVLSAVQATAVRVLLFTASGRGFCAGEDLAAFQSSDDRGALAERIIGPINEALLAMANSGLPSIAALQGVIAGGGISLALAPDLAIADTNVRFNFGYLKIAAPLDCGGSHALVRLVGPRKAAEIKLLNPILDAQEARQLGLVNLVVPPVALRDTARSWARRLAATPAEATARTLALLRCVEAVPRADQLRAEMEAFAAAARTEAFGQAIGAFFVARDGEVQLPAAFRP